VGSAQRRGVMLDIRENVTKHHLLTTHQETRDAVARLCLEFVEGLEASGEDGGIPDLDVVR